MEEKEKFDLFEYHNKFSKDIQISYKGPFDEQVLSVISKYIGVILAKDPVASKKLLKVFIELAQNIAYYSAEKSTLTSDKKSGIGTLVIGEFENSYLFVSGNAVRNDDVIPIIEKCEKINSLDHDSLREYKREQRNLPQGEKGSAHIGLIQVALVSSNPLNFEVTPIDEDHSYFSIAVQVDK